MDTMTYVAIAIFITAYALIISEKIHRTVVGLFGAMLMILLGIIDQETAVHHIDFNTIGLLMAKPGCSTSWRSGLRKKSRRNPSPCSSR